MDGLRSTRLKFTNAHLKRNNNSIMALWRNWYTRTFQVRDFRGSTPLGATNFLIMCMLCNTPKLDWDKVKSARNLIGNNLLDYEEFKPLVEMALNNRLAGLAGYCRGAGKDYGDMLRKQCDIRESICGEYLMILPAFMNRFDIETKTKCFVEWATVVGTILNKSKNKDKCQV